MSSVVKAAPDAEDGAPDVRAPSGPTMTRARWKLDMFNMFSRQWTWRHEGFDSYFVTLCPLAYFLGCSEGASWQLCLNQKSKVKLQSCLLHVATSQVVSVDTCCHGSQNLQMRL